MNEFYNLTSNSDGSILNIAINEDIGGPFGVTADDINQILNDNPDVKNIEVSINSAGGSLFQAISIFNQLESSSAFVTTVSTGVAASSGSIIFMAGDRRIVQQGGFVMVHKPMAIGVNNADEMRDKADQLDKFQDSIVDIYESKTGLSRDEINNLMNDETWLNASDALEKGFATESTEDKAEPQNKIEYEEFVNSCTENIPKEAKKYFKNETSYKIQRVLNNIKNNILNISPNEDDMKPEEVQNILAEALSKQNDEFSSKLKGVEDSFTNQLSEKDKVINSLQETVNAQSTKIEDLKNKAAASTIENIVDSFINEGKIAPKNREDEIKNLQFREGSDDFESYKNSIANREVIVDMSHDFAQNGAVLEPANIDDKIEKLLNDAGLTSDTATQEQYVNAAQRAGVK